MIRHAKHAWTSQIEALADPFDYDLYGIMYLEQSDDALVQVEVMLDETNLIVKKPGPNGDICSQDILGIYYNEIRKVESCKTRTGFELELKTSKISFYFSNELQRTWWIEELRRICFENNIHDTYAVVEQIVSGEDERVFQVQNIQTGKTEALRDFYKNSPNFNRASVDGEIRILRTLNHPNIIKLNQVFESDTQIQISHEYPHGGTLLDYVREHGPLSEQKALDLISQVLKAVDYLHKRKIAHLAIRPENVLIMTYNSLGKIKLSEFGLAEKMTISVKLLSIVETDYTAPELKRKHLVSLKADIFSCGMLLCYSLLGFNPLMQDLTDAIRPRSSSHALIEEILTHIGISENTKDLVAQMTNTEYKQRPFASEIPDHLWTVQGDCFQQAATRTLFPELDSQEPTIVIGIQ